MAYFFFHHPLDARNGIPGRYAFDVAGAMVAPEGMVYTADFRVAVDAMGDNKPGDNVDPCIFASPLGMAHTFCRLDRLGGKFYVPPERRNLAQTVTAGDVIFYGHLRTARGNPAVLFVDTVLVVSRTLRIPTIAEPGHKRRPYKLVVDEALASTVLPDSLSNASAWSTLLNSDLWRYNLADAVPGRGHAFTAVREHRMILSFASPAGDVVSLLRRRQASFIPLVDTRRPGRALPTSLEQDDERELWRQLVEWVSENPRLAYGIKPPTQLPERLGELLYDSLRRVSGRGSRLEGHVAVPPLVWRASGGAR